MKRQDYKKLTEIKKVTRKIEKPKPDPKSEKKTKALVPVADKNTYLPHIKGNC